MPYQFGYIDPSAAAPAPQPMAASASGGADPLDAFVASQGGLAPTKGAKPVPAKAAVDPLDSFVASQGGLPQQKTPPPAPAVDSGMAQDLAAGGASPYTLSDLRSAASGAWHGVSSMVNNAANLVEKGVAAGLGAIPGVRDTALTQAVARTADSDVAAQSAADQNFAQNASAGEKASAVIAPWLVPMSGLAKAGDAARAGVAMLPGMGGNVGRAIGTILANGTTGAAASAGAPIDPEQGYWPQVGKNLLAGAGIGAGLPAVFNIARGAGGAVYNAARPLLNPLDYVGEGLANAIGDDAAQVAANIRGAQTFVPGSLPTTAQVAGNPLLVQTQKALDNQSPDFKNALLQRGIDNNAARWQALNQVAGTPLQPGKAAGHSGRRTYDRSSRAAGDAGRGQARADIGG